METHPRVLIDLQRKPQPTDWTPEQLATLRRMAGKAPIAEIAAAVGRSQKSVCNKAAELRLRLAFHVQRAEWSGSEIVALRAMRHTHTLQQAAAVLGRSYGATHRKAWLEGISYMKRGTAHHLVKYSKSDIAQVVALREQGLSQKQISVQTGMSRSHASSILTMRSRYRETMQIYGELP